MPRQRAALDSRMWAGGGVRRTAYGSAVFVFLRQREAEGHVQRQSDLWSRRGVCTAEGLASPGRSASRGVMRGVESMLCAESGAELAEQSSR